MEQMDPIKVILLALLQGVAELFPVSSLGHTVIIPGILGWGDLLRSKNFLPLVVSLHLGTAIALLTFFWRDWVKLITSGVKVVIAGRLTPDVDPDGYGRQMVMVVAGTIPAGVIGLLFQKPLESLFSSPILASAFLAINGVVLLTAERLTQRLKSRSAGTTVSGGVTMASVAAHGNGLVSETTMKRGAVTVEKESLNQVNFGQAAIIGLAQALALFPGISRSGTTIVAGLSSGLSHEAAARFSFLLATPIIFAAGVLEIPALFSAGGNVLQLALLGGIISGVAAYLSVRFLMRYFETNRLDPFAYYCFGAGLFGIVFFLLRDYHVI